MNDQSSDFFYTQHRIYSTIIVLTFKFHLLNAFWIYFFKINKLDVL